MQDDERNRPRISRAPRPPQSRARGNGSPSLPVYVGKPPNWDDWRDYRTMPLWQAVLLALGKEPDDHFAPSPPFGGIGAPHARLLPEYLKRLDLACNHIKADELSTARWVPNTPCCEVRLTEFAAWWEARGWELPAEFPGSDKAMENKGETTAASSTPSPGRGRPKGSGSYKTKDEPLLLKMRERLKAEPGKAVTAVASELAPEAEGYGTPESKVKRLVKRYREWSS